MNWRGWRAAVVLFVLAAQLLIGRTDLLVLFLVRQVAGHADGGHHRRDRSSSDGRFLQALVRAGALLQTQKQRQFPMFVLHDGD